MSTVTTEQLKLAALVVHFWWPGSRQVQMPTRLSENCGGGSIALDRELPTLMVKVRWPNLSFAHCRRELLACRPRYAGGQSQQLRLPRITRLSRRRRGIYPPQALQL